MKKILALTVLAITAHSQAEVSVIYGKDNRRDLFQVTSSMHKKLALSTAAMIPAQYFKKSSRNGFFDLDGVQTLEDSANVCASEAFSQQPNPAVCSGFLVGPDTIITAGHCYKAQSTPEQACKAFAWVFDFHMKSSSSNPLRDTPLSNVYVCKQVIAAELSPTSDFAVIKLDRPVTGREALKFRTSGKISNSASLVVIGHPTGLPTKVSPGGKVTRNIDPSRFSTTLDTFHGNSGSAVFDAATGVVEGILIQGKTDYIPSKASDPRSCQVVNKCDENGNNCAFKYDEGPIQWGEVVLRLDRVLPHIQRSLKMTVKK